MERRDIRMDGHTSSVICSFRPDLDVRVGVYDPQEQPRVNVLCIPELHYCKSIVGVLQALCFLLSIVGKWPCYGTGVLTMSAALWRALSALRAQSADWTSLRPLSCRSAGVDAIVTDVPRNRSWCLINLSSRWKQSRAAEEFRSLHV